MGMPLPYLLVVKYLDIFSPVHSSKCFQQDPRLWMSKMAEISTGKMLQFWCKSVLCAILHSHLFL